MIENDFTFYGNNETVTLSRVYYEDDIVVRDFTFWNSNSIEIIKFVVRKDNRTGIFNGILTMKKDYYEINVKGTFKFDTNAINNYDVNNNNSIFKSILILYSNNRIEIYRNGKFINVDYYGIRDRYKITKRVLRKLYKLK